MTQRTREYAVVYAARPAKQKAVTANDLWNGINNPTLGAGDEARFDEVKITDSPSWFTDNSNNGTQLENGNSEVMTKADVTAKIKGYTEGLTPILSNALGWEALSSPITAGSLHQHLICYQPNGKDYRDWTPAEQTKITATNASGGVWASGE